MKSLFPPKPGKASRIAARPLMALAAAMIGLSGMVSAPALAADKMTVLLDWFVNPDHAPLVIAREKGFFTEAGLAVDLLAPADPNDPPKLVAAGQADLAVSYQPQLHIHIDQELPLVRVATLVSTPLNSLVALADGPVKSISDLKGRKVGVSVGGFEDALLGAMLQKHGLSLNDIELVNVNFSLSPALLAGQVDAVIGAFRNFELNQLQIEEKPGIAFFPEEEGVPPYEELIVIAHKDRAADPRNARFIAAVERATLYILNHPESAWDLFIKAYPDLNDELNRRAWPDTLRRFAHSPGALDSDRYARFADFLKASGLISKTVPVEQYAITVK